MPGYVATKLSMKKVGFTIPTTLLAAEGALKDLGKRVITFGVIDHHIIGWFIRLARSYIPSWIFNSFVQEQGINANTVLRKKNHSFV